MSSSFVSLSPPPLAPPSSSSSSEETISKKEKKCEKYCNKEITEEERDEEKAAEALEEEEEEDNYIEEDKIEKASGTGAGTGAGVGVGDGAGAVGAGVGAGAGDGKNDENFTIVKNQFYAKKIVQFIVEDIADVLPLGIGEILIVCIELTKKEIKEFFDILPSVKKCFNAIQKYQEEINNAYQIVIDYLKTDFSCINNWHSYMTTYNIFLEKMRYIKQFIPIDLWMTLYRSKYSLYKGVNYHNLFKVILNQYTYLYQAVYGCRRYASVGA